MQSSPHFPPSEDFRTSDSTSVKSYAFGKTRLTQLFSHIYTHTSIIMHLTQQLTGRGISNQNPNFPISLKSPKFIDNPTHIMELLAYYHLIRFRPLTSDNPAISKLQLFRSSVFALPLFALFLFSAAFQLFT